MSFNLPNILTLSRIVMIPIMLALFFTPFEWARYVCVVIFALASFTDWLDGYLARKHNQTSNFGAFLDPVADKLMVATALILVVFDQPHWFLVICAAVIVGREILVSALREWMAEAGDRSSVAVSQLAKIKTTVQMVAIGLLLWRTDFYGLPINMLGYIALGLSALLAVITMVDYLKIAWPVLTSKK